MADKDFIFERYTFANESMAGNLAATANDRTLLDFDKGADF